MRGSRDKHEILTQVDSFGAILLHVNHIVQSYLNLNTSIFKKIFIKEIRMVGPSLLLEVGDFGNKGIYSKKKKKKN